ncbi:MAG: bifunctional UDP-sugar hydrolase/5'-nucleotidase [Bacteroidota bacterium]|nr:bifunctional UDP-sugar hydrolase/5'-nucleotidase [Bacteroidota bacterium]
MIFRLCIFLPLLFISPGHIEAQVPVKLKIIHWNDFHAQNQPMSVKGVNGSRYNVGGFAYFKSAIDSLKYVAQSKQEAFLELDAGDNFQGTPISGVTRGESQIELLNLLHPDAVALGNHEFDYGWENLDSLIRFEARFDIVNANIYHPDHSSFAKPYIIRQLGKLRVAIIGLTVEHLNNLTLPERIRGLQIATYEESLRTYLKEIKKEKPSLIVVLSHIGVDADRRLANEFPQVNIFVGGHSHTPLKAPIKENYSLIVQAGSRGQFVGELELEIDLTGDSVLSYEGKLIETKNEIFKPDSAILRRVEELEAPVTAKYAETIGVLKKDWHVNDGRQSNLAAFESMVFRTRLSSDIGVINYGGLRKSLRAGNITMRDIYEINPFENELVSFDLRGDEVEHALEWMFDGKGSEFCEFSGLTCSVDTSAKPGNRIQNIRIDGTPMDPTKTYSIATNIFVGSHLSSIFGLNDSTHPLRQSGVTDFDLIVEAIRKYKEISGDSESWVKGL